MPVQQQQCGLWNIMMTMYDLIQRVCRGFTIHIQYHLRADLFLTAFTHHAHLSHSPISYTRLNHVRRLSQHRTFQMGKQDFRFHGPQAVSTNTKELEHAEDYADSER